MTLTINNQMLVLCFFFFCFSAFIAYLFKRSNLFFKMVLFIPFISMFAVLESSNRVEVSLCAILGIVFVFFDTILNFFYSLKLWIENIFYGFFSMIRRILRFFLIPIADLFTWFYNLLSRLFGWNRVFHKLGRRRENVQPAYDRPRRTHNQKQHERKQYGDKPRSDESAHRNNSRHQSGKSESPRDNPRNNDHRQSQGSGKTYQQDDKKNRSSNQNSTQQNGTNNKKISPEEQARLDAINRAKEEVRKAREQAKRKEEQEQGDNTAGDGRSYKEILGLSDNFSLADLMKAYKLGVSRYHPDKYSHMSESFQQEAQAQFIMVKKAYNALVKNFN